MSLARRARRIAVAAAYGGGGIGVLSAATAGLLVAEARMARRWIGTPTAQPPRADGVYGEQAGLPLVLVMVGDSTAAGLGVHRPEETPGALIAAGLAAAAARPVRLGNVARVGSQSQDLEAQVGRALAAAPDVAVVMIGANDVTHRVRPSASVRLLSEAVRRLRAGGVQVVVGTCPDLGTVEPVAQPLRYLARQWSRQLAAAQTIGVVESGGRTVSLGDLLGPEFAARPGELFGPDRFHPSAAGYRAAAGALLPSVLAALGFAPDEAAGAAETAQEPELRRVDDAAAEAAESAGTEVTATELGARERGQRGRWALLRHRRRGELPPAGGPEATSAGAAGTGGTGPNGGPDGGPDGSAGESGDPIGGSREPVPTG